MRCTFLLMKRFDWMWNFLWNFFDVNFVYLKIHIQVSLDPIFQNTDKNITLGQISEVRFERFWAAGKVLTANTSRKKTCYTFHVKRHKIRHIIHDINKLPTRIRTAPL
jgi:hypothetical protein